MYASIKEKGLKKGQTQNKSKKEMASATSERQRFAVDCISSRNPKEYPASDQVISAGDIQPNIHSFSNRNYSIKHHTDTIRHLIFQSTIYYTIKQASDTYQYQCFDPEQITGLALRVVTTSYKIVVLSNNVLFAMAVIANFQIRKGPFYQTS